MDKNNRKLKILYKCIKASAIWQHMLHIPPTKVLISKPIEQTNKKTRAIQKRLPLRKNGNWGKKRYQENAPKAEKDKTERSTGLGRRTRDEILKSGIKLATLRFQIEGGTSEIPRPPFGGPKSMPLSTTTLWHNWKRWHCPMPVAVIAFRTDRPFLGLSISSLHRITPREEFNVLWTENCTALSTNLTVSFSKISAWVFSDIWQESALQGPWYCLQKGKVYWQKIFICSFHNQKPWSVVILQIFRFLNRCPCPYVSFRLLFWGVFLIIQHSVFSFADPLWPCIKVKVIEASMSVYAYQHTAFGCHNFNTVRDMAIVVQV